MYIREPVAAHRSCCRDNNAEASPKPGYLVHPTQICMKRLKCNIHPFFTCEGNKRRASLLLLMVLLVSAFYANDCMT